MKANTLIFLAAIAAAVYFLMNKKPGAGGITTSAPVSRSGTVNPVLIPTSTTNNYGLNDANAARLKALTTLAGSGTDLFRSIWGTPSSGLSDADISDFVNLSNA